MRFKVYGVFCVALVLYMNSSFVKATTTPLSEDDEKSRLSVRFSEFLTSNRYDLTQNLAPAIQFVKSLETDLVRSSDPIEKKALAESIRSIILKGTAVGGMSGRTANSGEMDIFRGAVITIESLLPKQGTWISGGKQNEAYLQTLKEGVNLLHEGDQKKFDNFKVAHADVLNSGLEKDFSKEVKRKQDERVNIMLSTLVHPIKLWYQDKAINVGVGYITHTANTMYIPNMTVLQPYVYGLLFLPVSLKFDSSVFFPHLPQDIRNVLGNTDPRNVKIFLSVQYGSDSTPLGHNMIVSGDCPLLRPHYSIYEDWYAQHRDLTKYTVPKNSLWLAHSVKAGLFGSGEVEKSNVKLLSKDLDKQGLAPYDNYPPIPLALNPINHPVLMDFGQTFILHDRDGEAVVSTVVGGVLGIDSKKTMAFWSVVFDQTTGKYDVTLHFLPGGSDPRAIRKLVSRMEGKTVKDLLRELLNLKLSSPTPINELRAFLDGVIK